MYHNPYAFYQHPYEQNSYFPSQPFQSEDIYDEYFDERLFGPPPGAPGGPSMGGFPSGPPGAPGGPSMGFPSGPPGQGSQSGAPTSPPPSFVPAQTQQVGAFAIDPGSIRGCLFRYTYIWLRNRQQFWFYPTFLGRTSVSGWRWTGWNWVFFGVSLRQIESFTCV